MRIEGEVRREAQRLIVRHETEGRLLAEENARRSKRSIAPIDCLRLSRPPRWQLDVGFNPYVTRARSDRIAHSIRRGLRSRGYIPRHPVEYEIPKAAGGTRIVNIYQVADAAISKMLFEGVLKKNLPLLSARAYAYRKDVSAQDAIQYLKSELRDRKRVYIAEYDFRSFFDSIDHEHVRRVLNDHFLLTDVELSAIEAFLTVAALPHDEYVGEGGPERSRGIPQGTSVSLLLANAAAWELDRRLENEGVGFVRYADDTLIWSSDYARLVEAVDRLHEQADAMGVSVNLEKSPGVRVLVPDGGVAEMKHTSSIDYLGYRIHLDRVEMKEAAYEKVRTRIVELLYWSLLFEPKKGTQNPARIQGNVDQDYVSLIWRIRRYLYGDLTEKAVRRYQNRDAPLRRYMGFMSAYPLLDDTDQLRELDEWILTRIWLAVRRRGRLLSGSIASLPEPHGRSREELRELTATSTTSGDRIDLRVPSVRRVARMITAAAAQHGASVVGRPTPHGYS